MVQQDEMAVKLVEGVEGKDLQIQVELTEWMQPGKAECLVLCKCLRQRPE